MAASLSVIIPAHNSARYLPHALASVFRQHFSPIAPGPRQVIVVDDGSTDDTRAVIEAVEGVTYVAQARAGTAAARNAGMRLATGTFVAFLDADDCWAPDKTVLQLQHLAESDADMVFGLASEFYDESFDATGLPPPRRRVPALYASALLIRRDALERAGEFLTRWRVGEFIDWYLQAIDAGLTPAMLPEVVVHRRLHATNSGRSAGDGRQDYVRVIKRAIDRRRAAGREPRR